MNNKTKHRFIAVFTIILILSLIFVLWYAHLGITSSGTKFCFIFTSHPEKTDSGWYRVNITRFALTEPSFLGIRDYPVKVILVRYTKSSNISGFPNVPPSTVEMAYLNWKEQNYSADVLYVDADNDETVSVGDYVLLKSKDAGGFFTDDMEVEILAEFVQGKSLVSYSMETTPTSWVSLIYERTLI